MNIIITGGLGFIGSSLVKKLCNNKTNNILNIDAMTYCSMPDSLKEIKGKKNYFFKKNNLQNIKTLNKIFNDFKPNIIYHLAAESHVDNSIKTPDNFINTNILGTYNLLNASYKYYKKNKNLKFIHISTDEVYGSLSNKKNKSFTENSKFLPNSPYAASKASSDLLVRAWNKTYNLPTIITNCANNFGPWQYPEKLIPKIISCCLNNKKIPVYGNGKNLREWIFVKEHVNILIKLSKKGKIGETYNIGSGFEIDNLKLVNKICEYFDQYYPKKNSYKKLITFVKDRPSHDFRYSVNTKKIKKILNYQPPKDFEKNLKLTIEWYIYKKKWLNKILFK